MSHRLEASLAQDAFPPDGGSTECRVEIDPDGGAKTLPLHIVFCIDASGSMSGSEIRNAKQGVESAMERLTGRDKFGVVSFSNDAQVVIDETSGDRTTSAENRLDQLTAGGGTHIVKGLERSRKLLDSMSESGGLMSSFSSGQEAVQWIALVTDGRPGSISTPLRKLVGAFNGSSSGSAVEKHGAVAEALNDQGITIYTAGVGSNYGEDIIEAISTRSGGTWEHYSSSRGIGRFFKGKIDEARSVVATSPSLTATPKNGISITDMARTVPQMSDVEYETNGSEYVVDDVPDIRSDLAPEYIFTLDVPEHEIDPNVDFVEFTLDIGSDRIVERASGEFMIDNEMAREMDSGDLTVKEEAETVDNFLSRKDSFDQETKEEQSRAIARKRDEDWKEEQSRAMTRNRDED